MWMESVEWVQWLGIASVRGEFLWTLIFCERFYIRTSNWKNYFLFFFVYFLLPTVARLFSGTSDKKVLPSCRVTYSDHSGLIFLPPNILAIFYVLPDFHFPMCFTRSHLHRTRNGMARDQHFFFLVFHVSYKVSSTEYGIEQPFVCFSLYAFCDAWHTEIDTPTHNILCIFFCETLFYLPVYHFQFFSCGAGHGCIYPVFYIRGDRYKSS